MISSSNRHVPPEERLILLSAGTAERRLADSERFAELAHVVNWTSVADLLRARRLMPLLGPRILEIGADQAGPEFATSVHEALGAARRHGLFLQMVAAHIVSTLAEAEIRCATLKGPTMSEMLYGDPGRRISSDIDFLVAREQLHDAVAVVRQLGYEAPTDHIDTHGLPALHFALAHERGLLAPVELHWRIHWYERSFAGERLLPPIADKDAGAWRPAAVDELAALLLFYARDGFIDLRIATDLGAWWDVFGADLDPGALAALIRNYPALESVLLTAAKVAENIVGLPISAAAGQGAKLNGRSHIAVRLANPYPHASEAQLFADMGLIDGLLTPRGGFRAFLRRQLVPPRDVLREHARVAHREHASSSVGHCLRVLARYALAMTGLIRVPEARSRS